MHNQVTGKPQLAPSGDVVPGVDSALARLGEIILGKDQQLQLAMACLLARGHLLIEDLPGVGKTTLAHALAGVLGLHYQRIQFTSDLLPADILGISIYSRDSGGFQFHPGPVFSNIVLADEINRATPKTQSALLEAMEERQVTVEGETRPLDEPFFVIATQNPAHQVGTFPLPESQLDRFLMRIELGYPDAASERRLLAGDDRRTLLAGATPVMTPDDLMQLQAQVDRVHTSDAILDYLQALLAFSRRATHWRNGLSPRAGLALLHCARAWAFLEGHRLQPADDHSGTQTDAGRVRELFESVALP
jgi:MoxR-like ATPase